MDEERRQLCSGVGRPHRYDPILPGLPSRLQHENATNVVMEPHRLPALLQYRGARQLRIAAGDDPHRLAGRMHVRDVEAPSFHHIPFLPALVTAASQMNPYAVRVPSTTASTPLPRPACTSPPSARLRPLAWYRRSDGRPAPWPVMPAQRCPARRA